MQKFSYKMNSVFDINHSFDLICFSSRAFQMDQFYFDYNLIDEYILYNSFRCDWENHSERV